LLLVVHLIASAQDESAPSGANECPAGDTRCVSARSAFVEVMKVFDHPRCANCHGAFNVIDENRSGDHMGDHIAVIVTGEGEVEGSPLVRLLARDSGVLYPATRCPECHVNAPNVDREAGPLFTGSWRQPVENTAKMWGGTGAVNVCRALINFSDNPDQLVAHIEGDPLIALGFEGMRGMDAPGLVTTDGPEPPPLTKPQLIDALRVWLDAMEYREVFPADGAQSCDWVTGGAPPPASAHETAASATATLPTEDQATPTVISRETWTPTSTATLTLTPTAVATATRRPTSAPSATRPPTATAEPYWIFVLPQVSPSSTSGGALYVSTESDVRSSTTCSFEGGGIGCPSSERVQYQKLDNVVYPTKDAALAGLRSQTTECQNRAIVGWYGRARGQWYGLWNVPNKFSGGPGGVCP
jgi:hypothetical protein